MNVEYEYIEINEICGKIIIKNECRICMNVKKLKMDDFRMIPRRPNILFNATFPPTKKRNFGDF